MKAKQKEMRKNPNLIAKKKPVFQMKEQINVVKKD